MKPLNLPWPRLLPFAVAALACATLLVGLSRWSAERHRAEQAALVMQAMAAARNRLQATIDSTFVLTASLDALVRARGDVETVELDQLVNNLSSDLPQLRALAVAPDDVVRWVHPVASNRALVGLDYRSRPDQYAQLQRARQLRVPLVFAPTNLVQGGFGIVQRRPVFVRDAQGQERYWGMVSASAELSVFVARAELDQGPIDVLLAEQRANGSLGDTIWGSASLRSERMLRDELQLPGTTWALLARPKGGWQPWPWRSDPSLWIAALGSLLVLSLTLVLGKRREQLAQRSQQLLLEVEQRRASQAQAEAATQRFEELVKTSSDWLWEMDVDLRLSYVSQLNSDFNAHISLVLGKPRWEHPRLLPGVDWDAHRATLKRREPFRSFEYGVMSESGEALYMNISGTPVFEASGEFKGYRGTGRDVTAIRSAQAALAKANAEASRTRDELQALLDSAVEVSIVATDLDGAIRHFSRGAEKLLGVSAAEVLGTTTRQFYLESELLSARQELSTKLNRKVSSSEVLMRQAMGLDSGHTRLWTCVRPNGEQRIASHTFTRVHDRHGAMTGYVAIAQDVTERVQAEEALRQANARMQAVLDASVEVGILLADMNGRVLLFNRGAELQTGYSAEQVVGRIPGFIHDQQELADRANELAQALGRPVKPIDVFLHQAAQPPGMRSRQWTYIRTDGKRLPVSITLSEVRDSQGVQLGFLGIGRDISQQLQAEAQLLQLNAELEQRVLARTAELTRAQSELLRTERLAALGGLVAGVAHELNTPIGVSLTAASTLQERSQEMLTAFTQNAVRRSVLQAFLEDAHSVAELLMRSLNQASDLVSHFKQLSADQTSEQRRKFSLAQVLADVMVMLRSQLKSSAIEIELEVDPALTLDSYPGALGRLLSNLLLNAKLHAFDGHSGAELPRVTISARPLDAEHLALVVADNGVGMSAEVRRRAFDPFFSTKVGKGGTGLGLNIVHNVATSILGGTLRLESTLGEGTRFTLTLPLTAPLGVDPNSALTAFVGLR